ncbi:MAG TPA: trigger factor [Candidatus Manganitrophaceae bacterium]|nr:trigger factor [Candidatus Manganitrophaceae bacterium]
MKVQVEEITPVKKSLTIEIPQEVVSNEFAIAYSDLKKKAKIPGFRPGKVPMALLEKKFGPSIQEDVVRKLVPDYYQRAVKEAGLSPVEFPSIEKIEVKKDAPLLFTATVEVKPSIQLSNYQGLTLPRKKIEVAEEEVEKTLARLRDEQGHLDALPDDHAVAPSDYVIIDFEGSLDGKPVQQGKAEGYTLQVGSNTFFPEFESSLLGKKKGEQFEVDVPFPDDYQNKEIAGKRVHFKIHLKEVKTKILPELDDELAKDIGLPSLAELKDKIKNTMLEQRTSQQEHDQKNILIKKLVELHQFDVPPSMVEHELHAMADRLQEALPQKMDHETLHKEYEGIATERVKGTLILGAIAETEKIEVTDQELENEIALIAQRAKVSPAEAKRAIYQQEGSLEGLKSRVRQEKALNRVYALAQFEDKGETS